MATAFIVTVTTFVFTIIASQSIRQARTGKREPPNGLIFIGLFAVIVFLLIRAAWPPIAEIIHSFLERIREMQQG